MSEKTPLIHGKMIAVMKDITAIAKDNRNTMQGFNFRSIDDVYVVMHPLLKEHGIYCTPHVLPETVVVREVTTAKGGSMLNTGMSILFRFYCEDGSSVEVTMFGEGQDSGDKSSGKAQSMAIKQAYINIFAIPVKDAPQDRDPDYTSHEPSGNINGEKGLLFGHLKDKMRIAGIPSAGAESVIKAIIQDVLGKATIDARPEISRVWDAIDSGEYALDSGEKINV